ncbi:peptide ABC transporter periplasmic component SapA [Sphingopyxis sp. FD7]|nr:peptide ABC transporter periplasmic component SapA [Sphingopyxis sp. FD7]
MRGEIDEAGEETRKRLARAGRRDEQRVLAARRRAKHFGLMPPEPPPARGEPVGEGGGKAHGTDVATAARGGKRFG